MTLMHRLTLMVLAALFTITASAEPGTVLVIPARQALVNLGLAVGDEDVDEFCSRHRLPVRNQRYVGVGCFHVQRDAAVVRGAQLRGELTRLETGADRRE